MAVQNNLIGGTWTGASDTMHSINPSDTNDVVGEFAVASRDQVRDAIAAARAALPAWSSTTTQLRSDLLHNIGSELLAVSSSGIENRSIPPTRGRRRHHHAMEFSHRYSGVENRAGAGLRKLRCL